MANRSMTVEWTDAHEGEGEDRTIADEPWNEAPTRIAPASYDSETLDAAALFSDLQLIAVAPVTVVAPPELALMLPPAGPAASLLPALASVYSRAAAPTVRIRDYGPPANEARRAGAAAVAICGSLAFVAAIAAILLFYSASASARRSSAPSGEPALTSAACPA